LIFEKWPAGFRSRCEITARLIPAAEGVPAQEVSWAETTFVERYETTQSYDPLRFRRRISAPPGPYRIGVTAEDPIAGRKASKYQSVTILDPAGRGPALGRISIAAGNRDGVPLRQISFHIPQLPDSLGCAVDAYNFPDSLDARIVLSVLRFAVDTGEAFVPYSYMVAARPFGHSLVDFSRRDTVYSRSMTMRARRRDETLEFSIPPLPRGLFRIEITASTRDDPGSGEMLSAVRYFAIQCPGFPRPVTYSDLIDAAAYIATQNEMLQLRQARSPAEQRRQFEDLWLSFTGDPARASALLRKYYGRVAEANRLFTVVREGWKTDRGILYCILGPPVEVRTFADKQTWYYDLSQNASYNSYVFEHEVQTAEGLTLDDYYLYRQPLYEPFWKRIISGWRNGEAP
ncbi:MAG TPA: GWxTD domain-containing protein, partial [Bacteroidota bacterium]|nr:GWxTD domain-containing protein [Bacteroidota bacterium]